MKMENQNKSIHEVLSKEEQDFIIKHYQDMTDQEIADTLGRHRVTITKFRLTVGLYKEKEVNVPPKEKVLEKIEAAHKLNLIHKPDWKHKVGLTNLIQDTQNQKKVKEDIEVFAPKSEQFSENKSEEKTISKETIIASEEILLRREQQETKKQIRKALPKELWDDTNKVIDKFVLIKKDFTTEEWHVFLSHWARYLESYQGLLDIDKDFDDLVGIIRELIIQSRLFQDAKLKETKTVTINKLYNESVRRMQEFKKALENRIKERKKERHVGERSFAEIVQLFDSKEARKALAEADREDYEELWTFLEKVKRKMEEEKKQQAEVEFDGNEEILFLGADQQQFKKILDESQEILLSENLSKFEKGSKND